MTREASIGRARALMVKRDYSQLPVMNGERTAHGMVSWKSIGQRSRRGKSGGIVSEYMDPEPRTLTLDTPLTEAIGEIVKHEVVLVRGRDQLIVGIVTATDLSEQLHAVTEGFLILGEIEGLIRALIKGRFQLAELRAVRAPDSTRAVNGVDDLSMGEYQRLLDTQGNWDRLNVDLERAEFCKCLEAARKARNDIMHFRTGATGQTDLAPLREMLRLLRCM